MDMTRRQALGFMALLAAPGMSRAAEPIERAIPRTGEKLTVLGLGTWEVDARLTPAGWRIVEERLDSPLRVVVPKSE